MRTRGGKPSLAEMLLQHCIVFLICVVFPGVTTLLAPASWLSFHRSGQDVSCTTRTCVFFVVPFKVQTVDHVLEITSREREGRTEKRRRQGRTTQEVVHVDGEGFLRIVGAGGDYAEVSVSPASLEHVVERADVFLHSNNQKSTTIFAIANWKFGALMGGLLTSFTALYVIGYSLGFAKLLYVGLRRLICSALPQVT